ncbi:MAG TPA: FecR domain-containing protein [Pseudomonadales bacterium]|nr:FecR domain-containing protein [Pseudomonadales bacterium]
MTLLNRYSVLVTALLLGALALGLQAATRPAGVVLLVTGQANAQVSGESTRALSRRAEIYVGDRINTSADSQLQLRMKDGAMIALGANAEFIVKAYSDDATGDKKDEASLSLVKGGLRTISGQIDKAAYSMETPTATLGIRGTVFDVYVKADGTTVVILREGAVDVTSKPGGAVQHLTVKGLASIIEQGKAPTEPGPPPQDVLDYLRGILGDLPDNITWQTDGDGGITFKAGEDIINIINDHPPGIEGDGDVPGVPAGGGPACAPRDFACGCRQNPYGCG